MKTLNLTNTTNAPYANIAIMSGPMTMLTLLNLKQVQSVVFSLVQRTFSYFHGQLLIYSLTANLKIFRMHKML